MKHLPRRRASSSALASSASRIGLARPLAVSAVCALGLSMLGCGLFEVDGEDYESDYGSESDGATYTSATQSTPATSPAYTASPSTPAAPSSGTYTAPAQPAANSASTPARRSATNQASSAVCGSSCPDEPNVKAETTRCAGSPSQGPCYCAAALTYLCFAMNDCYREAGADTTVTEAQLNAGFDELLFDTADLGYACKYNVDGVSIDLTEIVVPGYADESAPSFGGGGLPGATPPAPSAAQSPSGRAGCNPCVEENCPLPPGKSCVALPAR